MKNTTVGLVLYQCLHRKDHSQGGAKCSRNETKTPNGNAATPVRKTKNIANKNTRWRSFSSREKKNKSKIDSIRLMVYAHTSKTTRYVDINATPAESEDRGANRVLAKIPSRLFVLIKPSHRSSSPRRRKIDSYMTVNHHTTETTSPQDRTICANYVTNILTINAPSARA